MPIQYRQLQGPSEINTSVVDNGGAMAAQSLANAFKSFEGTLSSGIQEAQATRGKREGATAGAKVNFGNTSDPKAPGFRRGVTAGTAYAEAYNNAALRSYAIHAEADIEDNAARLEVEAANDPEKFAATLGARKEQTLKHAPMEARAALDEMYTKRMTEGIVRLRTAQATDNRNQARTDTSEGIQRATDRIAQGYAANDPALHAQAEEEQNKLTALINGARNDGTLTQAEASAMHKSSQRSITEQTVTSRFRQELNNPYGDPIKFIERLREANKTSDALLPAEEEKLVDSLMGDLREANALRSMEHSQSMQGLKAKYEAGNREASSALLDNTLTQRQLLEMTRSGNLDPDRATSLLNQLHEGDPGHDDPRVALEVSTNLLKYTQEDISTMKGLKWSTRKDLILRLQKESADWKSTQRGSEGENRIKRALGILPGTDMSLLGDDKKLQLKRAITAWYDEVDALPPQEREGAVIRISEETARKYIRANKAEEAESLREAKKSYISRKGAPEGMNKKEKEAFEKSISRFDDDIAKAEAEAARQ